MRLPAVARLVALLVITALTIYYGVEMAVRMDPRTAAFLFWAWLTALAWLVVAERVLGLRFDLGDRWYRPRAWERRGLIYERLGVRQFKKVVPNGDYWNALRRRLRSGQRHIHNRASRQRWALTMRGKEAAHAIHALMVLPALPIVPALGWPDAAAWLLLFTIAFDLYPVMLQRYNRGRLLRAGSPLAKAHGGQG